SHGHASPPPEVVAVVCGMALRVLLSPSLVGGLVSERIGQYNYQMQQGTGTTGAVVRLTDADRAALARYRRTATTVQVRPWSLRTGCRTRWPRDGRGRRPTLAATPCWTAGPGRPAHRSGAGSSKTTAASRWRTAAARAYSGGCSSPAVATFTAAT